MTARSSTSVPSASWYFDPMAPQSFLRVETSSFCSMIRVLIPFSANEAPTSSPPVPAPMTRTSTSTVSTTSAISGSPSSQSALVWAARTSPASSAKAVPAMLATEATAAPATKLRLVSVLIRNPLTLVDGLESRGRREWHRRTLSLQASRLGPRGRDEIWRISVQVIIIKA